MKSNIAIESIYLFLILFLFYEGMYLLTRIREFDLWLRNFPGIIKMHRLVRYVVPSGEIITAFLLIWPVTRFMGLILGFAGSISFILYIIGVLLFTDSFVLPFHPYWPYMKWFDRLLIVLTTSWIYLGLLSNKRRTQKE